MIMRNIEFKGPFPMEKEAPESAGLYLVCTESSGGIRLIGVYEADNIRESIETNEFREKWNDYVDMDLFYYYSESDMSPEKRFEKCRDIIDTRPYAVTCVNAICDDW